MTPSRRPLPLAASAARKDDVATLTRMDAKKFPSLESLMGIKRKATRQTVSEMDAIFRAWAARG